MLYFTKVGNHQWPFCTCCVGSDQASLVHLYSLGIACAAVFLTYGDISDAASLMANIIIGTMIVTLMLERTRRALALISWFGSCTERSRAFLEQYF